MAKEPRERFSRRSKELISRVVERERQYKSLHTGSIDVDGIKRNDATWGTTRHTRLVKCATNSICSSYPSQGANKFPIQMGELTFDDTACGYELPVWEQYEPAEIYDRVALDFQGVYHEEDSYAQVTLHHGRWYFVPGGQATELIRFEIVSVNFAALTALVTITARTCALTSVTGESNDQITAYDPCGCFLDEPEVDLIGRCGTAARMLPDGVQDCRFEIWHLCCQTCDAGDEQETGSGGAGGSQKTNSAFHPGDSPGGGPSGRFESSRLRRIT